MRVLAISGSLQARSSHSALLRAAARLAPPGVHIELYAGIAALPHFNPDLAAEALPEIVDLYAQVHAADGLLIASPEYAHGVPGSLKNALDWLVGSPDFAGKPVAVLNLSERGEHARAALSEILTVMAARLVPEAAKPLMQGNGRKVDEDAILNDAEIRARLEAAVAAFASAIHAVSREASGTD